MKTFDLLKSYMQIFGYLPINSNYSGRVLSKILNICFVSIAILFFLSVLWYFSSTAQSLNEYTRSIYFMTLSSAVFVWYTAFLCKQKQFIQLFDDLEAIVQKSKLKKKQRIS